MRYELDGNRCGDTFIKSVSELWVGGLFAGTIEETSANRLTILLSEYGQQVVTVLKGGRPHEKQVRTEG